jgi:hypothetical protein
MVILTSPYALVNSKLGDTINKNSYLHAIHFLIFKMDCVLQTLTTFDFIESFILCGGNLDIPLSFQCLRRFFRQHFFDTGRATESGSAGYT